MNSHAVLPCVRLEKHFPWESCGRTGQRLIAKIGLYLQKPAQKNIKKQRMLHRQRKMLQVWLLHKPAAKACYKMTFASKRTIPGKSAARRKARRQEFQADRLKSRRSWNGRASCRLVRERSRGGIGQYRPQEERSFSSWEKSTNRLRKKCESPERNPRVSRHVDFIDS